MVSPQPDLALSIALSGALDIYRLTLPGTIQGAGSYPVSFRLSAGVNDLAKVSCSCANRPCLFKAVSIRWWNTDTFIQHALC